MDEIDIAAEALFPKDGSRRTLNFKVSGGSCVTAQEMARRIMHAENEVRSGRARIVRDID